MPISTWKTFWWAALFCAVGGSVMYVLVAIQQGLNFASDFMVWPIITFPLMPLSIWRLRRCYELEPLIGSGHWHLSMSDLIASSVITGLFLSAYQCVSTNTFLSFGVPFSFFLGAGTLAGFIYAARMGITTWRLRCFAAFGFSLWFFGALGTGSLLVVIVMVTYRGGHTIIGVFRDLLDPKMGRGDEWWFFLVFRLSLILGPIGFLCCYIANYIFMHSTPQTEIADSVNAPTQQMLMENSISHPLP